MTPARVLPSRARVLRSGLAVAAVLAVLAAAWFGVSWFVAAQDDGVARAHERDAALRGANEALATLHTVDHRHAERDVGRWIAVTTGSLRGDLDGDRDGEVKRARKAKTVTTATTLRAALTELDADRGTAVVIAVLEVERKGAESERRRLSADLLRTDGGWRVSAVTAAR